MRISVPRIRALIEAYRERGRTGLMRLAYLSEERLNLLFKRGEIMNAFRIQPNSWESLSPDAGLSRMEEMGDAYTRLTPLSTVALNLFKIHIQSPAHFSENFANRSRLVEFLAMSQNRTDTALLQLSWKNADGLLFRMGSSAQPYSVFVSQDDLLDESGVASIFNQWEEPHCIVARYMPDMNVDAWQEYYLWRAFAGICERALSHFETITGRAMVESLIRMIAVYASRQNLEISIASRQMVNREVFSTPQHAAENYRNLLLELFQHFSAIIGSRLLSTILNDIASSLHPLEQQMLRQFELLPEGTLNDA